MIDPYTHLWLHEPSGGYGYIVPVPCRLLTLSASGKRMQVAALMKDGTEKTRWVKIENLKLRDRGGKP